MSLPSRLLSRFGPPRRQGKLWAEWPCPRCPKGASNSVLKWRQGYRGAKCYACGLWEPCGSESQQEDRGGLILQGYLDNPVWNYPREELPEDAREEMARWMVCNLGSEEGRYLRLRGLQDWEILKYFVYDPHYPDYVIYPIREGGRTVSWQGRRVQGDGAKSISARTATGWQASTSCVWGLDRIQPRSPVYVCEGIFDAFHFPTGVAILNSHLNEIQARKILDQLDPLSQRIIYVCPDADNIVWTTYSVPPKPGWTDLLYELDRSLLIERKILPSGVKDFGELLQKGERHV